MSRKNDLRHQILSPHLGWTTAKIAERLADSGRRTVTFITPGTRRAILDDFVDIEVTGPIRFLDRRDPLVAAQMRAFACCYSDEGGVDSYLLPQALLELKARLSSSVKAQVEPH